LAAQNFVIRTRTTDAHSGSFLWSYPGYPLQVRISLEVIERLRAEVSRATDDREVWGVLIGTAQSEAGFTNVVDFASAPQETSDSRFQLPSDFLDDVARRCLSDRKVVGYYRTKTDNTIRLGPEDLELIQQRFKDPAMVFLVAAPGSPQPVAGCFCWMNERLAGNAGLTFPLSGTALVSGGWQVETGQRLFDKLTEVASRITDAVDLRRRQAIAVAITLLIALFVSGGLAVRWATPAHTSVTPPALALQAARQGQSVVLTWNWDDTSPAFARVQSASLEVAQLGRPSVFVDLTPEQLRKRSLIYDGAALAQKTEFHLNISLLPDAVPVEVGVASIPADTGGPTATESVALRPAPAASPSLDPSPPRLFIPPWGADAQEDSLGTPGLPQPPRLDEFAPPRNDRLPLLAHLLSADRPSFPGPAPERSSNSELSPGTARTLSGTGLLTITSDPPGATVEINQSLAGLTPLVLRISPIGLGFTVAVTKDGYTKWSVQSVATAMPYSLHAQLTPK
jgi:hypothetical protein